MKKNILIFGSEGLIGQAICSFLSNGYNVFRVDNKLIKNQFYYRCNINSDNEIKKLFKHYKRKKIFFSSIINVSYPKSKVLKNSFLEFNVLNFKKNLTNHLVPFYSILINSYKYYINQKKSGQIISFSSIYGTKVPNFNIYKNTEIKSPIYYSAAKASIIILSNYFAKWSRFNKKNIFFTCVSPAGVRNNQSNQFQKNYELIYKNKMLEKEDIAKQIKKIIINPKKYSEKNILITNRIVI